MVSLHFSEDSKPEDCDRDLAEAAMDHQGKLLEQLAEILIMIGSYICWWQGARDLEG